MMIHAVPLKTFEITDEMIGKLQEYLGHFVRYMQTSFAIGRWILLAGGAAAVIALLSRVPAVREFFKKRRVRR